MSGTADDRVHVEDSTTAVPVVAEAQASRSIFSYFNNGSSTSGAGPSRPPPAAPGGGPKKRRQKDAGSGAAGSQARLRTNGNGEAGWVLGKHGETIEDSGGEGGVEAGAAGVGKAARKRASKGRDEGEEAETREMKRKMREAAMLERKATGAQKSRKKGVGGDQEERGGPEGTGGSGTQTSPVKRTNGRSRKSTTATASASAPSPSPSQDPPAPIDLSSHPSSDPPEVGAPGPAIFVHRTPSPGDIVFTGHLKSDKPTHPLFSRTNSAMSTSTSRGGPAGASQQDPIDIDDVDIPPASANAVGPTAKKPRKTVFVSDTKPAHSFFSRVANGEVNGTRAGSVVSETATTEVSVAGSTTSRGGGPKGKDKEKAKVHSFFKSNGQAAPGALKEGWGQGVSDGLMAPAPWPGGVWPSHTLSASQPASAIAHLPPRTHTSPPKEVIDDFWESLDTDRFRSDMPPLALTSPSPLPVQTSTSIDKHPAIVSLPSRGPSDRREMWTEHYRPLRACEVLGNEIEATYLRDWLRALAVNVGGKGAAVGYPKVVRKIKKVPFKPQSFDGWLVDDIGLFEDDPNDLPEEEEELDFVEIEEAPLPFSKRPAAYPDFKGRLANAILLLGPPGTGKSAAIHAVTAELGWDVFEVYPGIGKRTGTNLFGLVGDVGRNHMVVKSKEEHRPVGKSFFGGTRTSPRKPGVHKDAIRLGSQEQPIDLDPPGTATGEDEVVSEESKFRQSVILLDEVDLLFDEENTFWPAVRSLIAESKRPVILTCNDPETIPLATLPLQTILDFRPPPRSLAANYLLAIARAEHLSTCDIPALLASHATTGLSYLVEGPLPPNGHEPMPLLDLRKTITQLQLDRGTLPLPQSEVAVGDLEAQRKQLEARSFADAMIAPRAWALLDEYEIDRYEPSGDDLLDVHLLVKPPLPDNKPIIPGYDLSTRLGAYLQHLAGGSLPSRSCPEVLPAQTSYIRSLLPVLDPLIPLGAHLLPHPSLFLDHLSIIRAMVRADDMLQDAEEAALAEGGDRINRKTGRPVRATAGREAFQRYLYQLNPAACSAALASELVFSGSIFRRVQHQS